MVGDALKRTRAIYGYKASEISVMLGISNSYLSEIENNKKSPSLELLQKYAEIFGVRVSSLILLSENLVEAEKQNRGQEFVKKMMLRFIEHMSRGEVDSLGEKPDRTTEI